MGIKCDGELHLGKSCKIAKNVDINCKEKFYLGDNSIIGDNVKISSEKIT